MSGLTEVYISTSVTKIEQYAFVSCSKLTQITFLEPAEGETADNLTLNIEFIGTGCTKITTINLPARLNEFTKYDSQSDLTISEAFVKLTNLKILMSRGAIIATIPRSTAYCVTRAAAERATRSFIARSEKRANTSSPPKSQKLRIGPSRVPFRLRPHSPPQAITDLRSSYSTAVCLPSAKWRSIITAK